MSVLIKNMEMPERCGMCFLRVGDCKQRIYMERRPKGCPLVEVKEPHDDLVDRGWVRDSINHSCWLEHNDYLEAIGIIDDAPNVIEAEGNEE